MFFGSTHVDEYFFCNDPLISNFSFLFNFEVVFWLQEDPVGFQIENDALMHYIANEN